MEIGTEVWMPEWKWQRGLVRSTAVVPAVAGTHTERALTLQVASAHTRHRFRLRGNDGLAANYFFDGAAGAAAPPGLRKYLKNSEPESSTITSPWFLNVVR